MRGAGRTRGDQLAVRGPCEVQAAAAEPPDERYSQHFPGDFSAQALQPGPGVRDSGLLQPARGPWERLGGSFLAEAARRRVPRRP